MEAGQVETLVKVDTLVNEQAVADAKRESRVSASVPFRRDLGFWAILLACFIATLLTAVEFTSIGTALPVIVDELGGGQFVWVGSAYTLGSSALLPFTGGISQILGRRPVMLVALALFALGSAVAGAAHTMNMLIVGRTFQGLGAGALTSMSQIIIADMIPLRERGSYNGLMALAWAIGGGTGPLIGGALAEHGQWRWLFYLNLPICGIDAILVIVFLRLRTPGGALRDKLRSMDWVGNMLITSSTTSVVIALTWGGVVYSWQSARVLVPLVLGLIGLAAFVVYEMKFVPEGVTALMVPPERTAFSGYTQNFLMGIVLATIAYWVPVYFQACKEASPIAAGVDSFALSYTISPMSVITGVLIQKTQRYRPFMWVGWVFMIVGVALLCTLGADSSRGSALGYQILAGIGIGIVYIAAYFPVMGATDVKQSTPALAFFTFLRNFALVWGVTLGGAVLQNQLKHNLPPAYLAKFPQGADLAFAAIPSIPTLPEPLKSEVRKAFADALRVVWEVLAGVTGVGIISSLFMKHYTLHTMVDEDFGRKEKHHSVDADSTLKVEHE
ncbi:MFS general substrate transporter [Auriscalpium vulgare]|uniref:MFS general substrate transporter n=1 Tax=Auriscalpium vulgare TaxID=40419 RepID=A0ACB8RMU2_9AGAM|nr:MFS general substrate transporter [Auriscalpium vulgare]